MESVECVVVGAGVIGLAVARALARAGREVVVVERENLIGTHTSSRNSEVIHAGLYYRPGSMKARFCVAGRDMLYDYCSTRQVPFRRCGKLIVATDEDQLGKLQTIRETAARNGVHDLTVLTAAQASEVEPEIRCTGALLSPATGIIDSHALMLSFQGEAEAAGAMLALGSPLLTSHTHADGFDLSVGGAEPMELRARILVNAAGLFAPQVAAAIEGFPLPFLPTPYFARGSYMMLSGRSPFSRLIYPVPVPGGLGIHLTLDLGGQARFGPDVEWIDGVNYSMDGLRSDAFLQAIRRYWPDIDENRLHPGYAGIRPKLTPASGPESDFVIQDSTTHGLKGLINLFGIESPGLTSSLAIADHVAQRIEADFAE